MVASHSGRNRRVLGLVVGSTLALAACSPGAASPASSGTSAPSTAGSSPAGSGSAAPTEKPEPTAVKFLLPSPLEIKYYMPVLARDLGYFEEEGLEVSIEPTNGSSFVLQLVSTGQAEFGQLTPTVTMAGYQQSPTFQAIYQYETHAVFSLYTTEESDVEVVADLKGRNVGVNDLNGGEVVDLKAILVKEGLAPTDVNLVPLGFNLADEVAAFKSGQVDAMISAWNFRAAAEVAGLHLKCLDCEHDVPGDPVIASKDYIASNPDKVEGMGRALAKATLFAATNPEAAYELLSKSIPENFVDPNFAQRLLDISIEWTIPYDLNQGYGFHDRGLWETKMNLLLLPGTGAGLDAPVNLDELLNNSFVPAFNDFDHEAIKAQAEAYPSS